MSTSFLNDNHNHSFNVGIRKSVGCTDSALIHFHIAFWVRHNFTQKTKDHFHKNRWWTYLSQSSISNHFEYLNRFQVQRCIKKLVEADLIITDNFNKKSYDKTTWYTLTDKAISILGLGYPQPLCENAQSDNNSVSDMIEDVTHCNSSLCENAQPLCENAQPIPDNNADTIRRTYVPNVRSFKEKNEERKVRDLVKNALGGKPLNLQQAASILKNHTSDATIEWSLNNYIKYLETKHGRNVKNKVGCFIYHIENYGYYQDEPKTNDKNDSDLPVEDYEHKQRSLNTQSVAEILNNLKQKNN